MRDGRFVTPFEQPGHNAAMRARIAIRPHSGLVIPDGNRPKSVPGFPQYLAAEKVRCVFRLARGLQCLPNELW